MTALVPDADRVAACRRDPVAGPRVLFFTGGSALRRLSRELKLCTHNSIHLVASFDSGGSSASIRRAFGMLSVGDLRNRLIALADETSAGNPEIYRLLSHRMSEDAVPDALARALSDMVDGIHPLVAAVPERVRAMVRARLAAFAQRCPADFDMRGASIGNLVLAGGYLERDRDLGSVIAELSEVLTVRGRVTPIAEADVQLAARLTDGSVVVGQHLLTGKEVPPIASPVADVWLARAASEPEPMRVPASREALALLAGAELICYPMGSFYSSVAANLLPAGVGRAIRASRAPKVYVPSTGHDVEQIGTPIHACAARLVDLVRRDPGDPTSGRALDVVLLDRNHAAYEQPIDTAALAAAGVQVLEAELVDPASGVLDPGALADALLTLTPESPSP